MQEESVSKFLCKRRTKRSFTMRLSWLLSKFIRRSTMVLLIISSQSLLTFQFGVNCGRHFSSEMEDSENLCYSFCCSLLAETTAASALSVIKLCCIRYAQGHFVSFLVEEWNKTISWLNIRFSGNLTETVPRDLIIRSCLLKYCLIFSVDKPRAAAHDLSRHPKNSEGNNGVTAFLRRL